MENMIQQIMLKNDYSYIKTFEYVKEHHQEIITNLQYSYIIFASCAILMCVILLIASKKAYKFLIENVNKKNPNFIGIIMVYHTARLFIWGFISFGIYYLLLGCLAPDYLFISTLTIR